MKEPSTRIRKAQEIVGLMQKNMECSICLDLLKNPVSTKCDHQFCRQQIGIVHPKPPSIVTTKCDHQFCRFCIVEFLRKKSSAPCPLCKKAVTKRSLSERPKLGDIVDGIRDLISAFQEDTGVKYTPPRGPLNNSYFPCTPEPALVTRSSRTKRRIDLPATSAAQNDGNLPNIRQTKRRKTDETIVFIDDITAEDEGRKVDLVTTHVNISGGFPAPRTTKRKSASRKGKGKGKKSVSPLKADKVEEPHEGRQLSTAEEGGVELVQYLEEGSCGATTDQQGNCSNEVEEHLDEFFISNNADAVNIPLNQNRAHPTNTNEIRGKTPADVLENRRPAISKPPINDETENMGQSGNVPHLDGRYSDQETDSPVINTRQKVCKTYSKRNGKVPGCLKKVEHWIGSLQENHDDSDSEMLEAGPDYDSDSGSEYVAHSPQQGHRIVRHNDSDESCEGKENLEIVQQQHLPAGRRIFKSREQHLSTTSNAGISMSQWKKLDQCDKDNTTTMTTAVENDDPYEFKSSQRTPRAAKKQQRRRGGKTGNMKTKSKERKTPLTVLTEKILERKARKDHLTETPVIIPETEETQPFEPTGDVDEEIMPTQDEIPQGVPETLGVVFAHVDNRDNCLGRRLDSEGGTGRNMEQSIDTSVMARLRVPQSFVAISDVAVAASDSDLNTVPESDDFLIPPSRSTRSKDRKTKSSSLGKSNSLTGMPDIQSTGRKSQRKRRGKKNTDDQNKTNEKDMDKLISKISQAEDFDLLFCSQDVHSRMSNDERCDTHVEHIETEESNFTAESQNGDNRGQQCNSDRPDGICNSRSAQNDGRSQMTTIGETQIGELRTSEALSSADVISPTLSKIGKTPANGQRKQPVASGLEGIHSDGIIGHDGELTDDVIMPTLSKIGKLPESRKLKLSAREVNRPMCVVADSETSAGAGSVVGSMEPKLKKPNKDIRPAVDTLESPVQYDHIQTEAMTLTVKEIMSDSIDIRSTLDGESTGMVEPSLSALCPSQQVVPTGLRKELLNQDTHEIKKKSKLISRRIINQEKFENVPEEDSSSSSTEDLDINPSTEEYAIPDTGIAFNRNIAALPEAAIREIIPEDFTERRLAEPNCPVDEIKIKKCICLPTTSGVEVESKNEEENPVNLMPDVAENDSAKTSQRHHSHPRSDVEGQMSQKSSAPQGHVEVLSGHREVSTIPDTSPATIPKNSPHSSSTKREAIAINSSIQEAVMIPVHQEGNAIELETGTLQESIIPANRSSNISKSKETSVKSSVPETICIVDAEDEEEIVGVMKSGTTQIQGSSADISNSSIVESTRQNIVQEAVNVQDEALVKSLNTNFSQPEYSPIDVVVMKKSNRKSFSLHSSPRPAKSLMGSQTRDNEDCEDSIILASRVDNSTLADVVMTHLSNKELSNDCDRLMTTAGMAISEKSSGSRSSSVIIPTTPGASNEGSQILMTSLTNFSAENPHDHMKSQDKISLETPMKNPGIDTRCTSVRNVTTELQEEDTQISSKRTLSLRRKRSPRAAKRLSSQTKHNSLGHQSHVPSGSLDPLRENLGGDFASKADGYCLSLASSRSCKQNSVCDIFSDSSHLLLTAENQEENQHFTTADVICDMATEETLPPDELWENERFGGSVENKIADENEGPKMMPSQSEQSVISIKSTPGVIACSLEKSVRSRSTRGNRARTDHVTVVTVDSRPDEDVLTVNVISDSDYCSDISGKRRKSNRGRMHRREMTEGQSEAKQNDGNNFDLKNLSVMASLASDSLPSQSILLDFPPTSAQNVQKELGVEDSRKQTTNSDSRKQTVNDSQKQTTNSDSRKQTVKDSQKQTTNSDSRKQTVKDSQKQTTNSDSRKHMNKDSQKQMTISDSKKQMNKDSQQTSGNPTEQTTNTDCTSQTTSRNMMKHMGTVSDSKKNKSSIRPDNNQGCDYLDSSEKSPENSTGPKINKLRKLKRLKMMTKFTDKYETDSVLLKENVLTPGMAEHEKSLSKPEDFRNKIEDMNNLPSSLPEIQGFAALPVPDIKPYVLDHIPNSIEADGIGLGQSSLANRSKKLCAESDTDGPMGNNPEGNLDDQVPIMEDSDSDSPFELKEMPDEIDEDSNCETVQKQGPIGNGEGSTDDEMVKRTKTNNRFAVIVDDDDDDDDDGKYDAKAKMKTKINKSGQKMKENRALIDVQSEDDACDDREEKPTKGTLKKYRKKRRKERRPVIDDASEDETTESLILETHQKDDEKEKEQSAVADDHVNKNDDVDKNFRNEKTKRKYSNKKIVRDDDTDDSEVGLEIDESLDEKFTLDTLEAEIDVTVPTGERKERSLSWKNSKDKVVDMSNVILIDNVNVDNGSDVDNDADLEKKVDVDNGADVDNDADIDNNTDGETGVEADVDNKADVDTDSDVDNDADVENEANVDTDSDVDNDADVNGETNVDSEADIDNQSVVDHEAVVAQESVAVDPLDKNDVADSKRCQVIETVRTVERMNVEDNVNRDDKIPQERKVIVENNRAVMDDDLEVIKATGIDTCIQSEEDDCSQGSKSANQTSSSAFSTQSEVICTQQQSNLEKDVERMKREIAELETRLATRDSMLLEKTLSDTTIHNLSREATQATQVENNIAGKDQAGDVSEDELTNEVIPPTDATAEQGNSDEGHSSGEESGDLFLSPRSPSPPPLLSLMKCTTLNLTAEVTEVKAILQKVIPDMESDKMYSCLSQGSVKSTPPQSPKSMSRPHHPDSTQKTAPKSRPVPVCQDQLDGMVTPKTGPKSNVPGLWSRMETSKSLQDHLTVTETPKSGSRTNSSGQRSRTDTPKSFQGQTPRRTITPKSGSSKTEVCTGSSAVGKSFQSPAFGRVGHPRVEKRVTTPTSNRSVLSPVQTSNMSASKSVSKFDRELSANGDRKLCFVTTGLHLLQAHKTQKLANSVDAKVLPKFSPTATHVIVKTVSEDSHMCERTLKYFQAVAHHCWLVSYKWVEDCMSAGQILPEEKYEIQGDTVSGPRHCGPRRSRLQQQQQPVFSRFEFCCLGDSPNLPAWDMQALFDVCGAAIITEPETLGSTGRLISLIINLDEEQEPDDIRFFNKLYKRYSVLTVSREWLFDSIAQYKPQALENYVLTAVKNMKLPSL